MYDLNNKNIIVTGASSGLGRAVAIKASRAGARVCLIGRNNKQLEETNSLMKKNDHFLLSTDLCDFDEYDKNFKNIVSSFGELDGLVHFAGIHMMLPLKVMKLDKLKEMLDINLLAFFELIKHFSKKNNFNKSGASIIGASSVMSLRGAPALSGYGCSKAALDGAVRSLACEFAPKKIRINSVASGFVKTPLNDKVFKALSPEAVDKIISSHPLGIGTPEDIANLVTFLLSDDARWITGSTISIDGGFSISS
ncbi:SDR family NAD(P)-dependent oxidoreductase [Nitrospinaceae bacterium]|nr:SDR family NAD(P)-dependent oxidoreductase [Nitrospinaceae bacterium]